MDYGVTRTLELLEALLQCDGRPAPPRVWRSRPEIRGWFRRVPSPSTCLVAGRPPSPYPLPSLVSLLCPAHRRAVSAEPGRRHSIIVVAHCESRDDEVRPSSHLVSP